jgi:hypothetical protein
MFLDACRDNPFSPARRGGNAHHQPRHEADSRPVSPISRTQGPADAPRTDREETW